jgi:hypothetical protein
VNLGPIRQISRNVAWPQGDLAILDILGLDEEHIVKDDQPAL